MQQGKYLEWISGKFFLKNTFIQANLSSQTWKFTLFKIPVYVLKDYVLEMYILIIKSCFSLKLCALFRLSTSGSTEGSISPLKASRVMAVTSPSAERISRLSTSSGSNLKRFFSSSHFGSNAYSILQWLSAHLQPMKRLLFMAIRLKFTYSDLLFH